MRFTSLFLVIVVLLTLAFTAAAQEAHTVFRHGGSVQTVAYSPGNLALFASAGDTGAVKLWNLQDDTVTTLGSHANTVNALTFSPNGRWLVSGSDDYTFNTTSGSGRLLFPAMARYSPREITGDRLTSGTFKTNVLLRNSTLVPILSIPSSFPRTTKSLLGQDTKGKSNYGQSRIGNRMAH